jgi:hypothetical protein
MKWLVIIVILLAVVAAVWLRMVRQARPAGGSEAPHRLDDAVDRPSTTGTPPLDPSAPIGGTLFDPEPPRDQPAPGSDLAQEPGSTADAPRPEADPPSPQGRPND